MNNKTNICLLNDSLEETIEDYNNLEYTKSNGRTESKSYRVSDLPFMDFNEEIFMKNDPQNNYIVNTIVNKNDSCGNDEEYKKLITNKRINMTNNKYNSHYNNQNTNNLIIPECFSFNNNLSKNQGKSNNYNSEKNIEEKENKNISNIYNINNSTYSTQIQTGSHRKNKINKGLNYNNKLISEFRINDFLLQKNNYKGLCDLNDNTELNREYLKNWLRSINLFQYYNNFIENNVYDINKLVQLMNFYETKLKYDDIEILLGIKKPGHIFRILIKLEIDCDIIDNKLIKFMIKKSTNENEKNIKISISDGYECGCFKNKKISFQKNELKTFLKRKNLMQFYQNFEHNGFELIEYVLIQMYSSFPINDDILENCFHIYDKNDRINVLRNIVNEMKKINIFLNSKEYENNSEKDKMKYENIQLEDFEENTEIKKDNLVIENCNVCDIF